MDSSHLRLLGLPFTPSFWSHSKLEVASSDALDLSTDGNASNSIAPPAMLFACDSCRNDGRSRSFPRPTIEAIPTYDTRERVTTRVRAAPVVHIARGYERHLPFLRLENGGRPLICISDWQFDTASQEHLWEQVLAILKDTLSANDLSRALVLLAGDMASASNELRGTKSDAAPQLRWLWESIQPTGDLFMIYGNHDLMDAEHLQLRNAASRLPALLPQGAITVVPSLNQDSHAKLGVEGCAPSLAQSATDERDTQGAPLSFRPQRSKAPVVPPEQLVGLTKAERAALYAKCQFGSGPKLTKQEKQEKQWRDQNQEQAKLLKQFHEQFHSTIPPESEMLQSIRIGAVHGIPASHSEGLRKVGRKEYFQAIEAVCGTHLDILVTHSNPQLPGQEAIVHGEDAPRLFELFMRSSAALHVHGHMHTKEIVSVVGEGKVVVNSDCRVIVFVPA